MKRLRRIWKWTWRTTVVLLVLTYLLRNLVVAPFAVGKAQPAIAEALGTELEISGFGGSWLGGLTLEQVASAGEGTKTPLKSVTLKGLEVDFSLWALLRGNERWLKSVKVAELALALDLDQTTPSEEEEDEASEPSAIPGYLPPVTIEKLELELWQGDVHLQMPQASLAGEWEEALDEVAEAGVDGSSTANKQLSGQTRFQFTTQQTGFQRGEQRPPDFDLSLALQYSAGELQILDLVVDGVQRVHTGWADLGQAHLGALQFDFDLAVMDGRVKAEGGLKDQRIDAEFLATGLQAETLNPWLDLGLRGELEVRGTAAVPLDDLRAGVATVEFGAQQNGWQKLELQAIDGKVELKDGWLSTNQFSATGEGLDLRADGVRLPLFEPLDKWNAQGHFSLAVDHLPTWLHRSGVELPEEIDLLHGITLDGSLSSHPNGLRVEMTEFELGSELGSLVSNADIHVALDGLQFKGLATDTASKFHAHFAGLDLQDVLERTQPDDQENPLVSGIANLKVNLAGTPDAPKFVFDTLLKDLVPTTALPELENLPAHGRVLVEYESGKVELKSTLSSDLWMVALGGDYDLALDLNRLIAGELPSGDGSFYLNNHIKIENPGWAQGSTWATTKVNGTLAAWVPSKVNAETSLIGHNLAPPQNLKPLIDSNPKLEEQLAGLSLTTLSVDLNGAWTTDAVQPMNAKVSLIGLDTGNDLPIMLELDASWDDGLAKLSRAALLSDELDLRASAELPLQLDADFQATLPEEVPLNLKAQLGELDLAKLKKIAAPWSEMPELTGYLQQAGFQLAGTWDKPELQANVHAKQVHLPAQDGTLLPDPTDFDLALNYADGLATLTALEVSAPQIQVNGGGTWKGEVDLAALTAGEDFEPGVLDIFGKLESPDLTWLGATGAVRRAEGALAADWKVQGSTEQPSITANWEMQNGALRLNSASTAAMENLNMRGSYEDGLLTLAHMEGDLGSAPFTAGGTVDLRRKEPAPVAADGTQEPVDPELDIKLNGTDLLLFRQQGVKLRSDADLHIHGLLSQLKVEGDIELTDGRYTKPVDFFLPLLKEGSPPSAGVEGISLFSLAAPMDNMTFDVAVHPGSGFRVKTNVANGLIEPKLKLVGTGEVPYLLGEVYIDRFLLSLPANNIRIERGTVRFLEENPFIPTLDIRAGYRRFGYDVTILVHGDLSAPEITMSSIPPLQAEELLLLTTTGQPPSESTDAESALGTVAVYLAKDWIRRFFGDMSTEDEESMLDRLEIEFGRDATQQGAETIEGRFLLREQYFRDNDALFLTGERDAYGDFNLGFRIRFLFP